MSVRKAGRLWSRLARADRHELLDRGRQEIARRGDGLLAAAGYDFARSEIGGNRGQPGAFFFSPGAVPSIVELLRQRLPQQVQSTVAQAEKICQHKFDLLGYENLDYGREIDWHLDRVHGKRAPRELFYKIPYLDFDQVGDSKVTWELNRHQHLVTLAKAYRFTGKDCYATELIAQWNSWQRNNPYPIGINWASSLEVAFRSLSWFWMYYLLEGTQVLSTEFRREWLRGQALNGRHIERYLSTYFSPNTHLLGEAVALFFIGTLCPELKSAARWKSLGWKIVLHEARRQVQADGFHFEQSVYYHVYALDLFLHATLLASANGVPAPKHLEETLVRMMDALALLSRFGPPPRIGDDDGGRLFDARRNRDENLTDPLASGAVLFGRGDFKGLVRDLREETIWLLGPEAVGEWDRIEPQRAGTGAKSLRSAGLYCLTSDDPGAQLIIDAGPQGTQTAGHGHADALSIWLQSNGRNLLIDPGTASYVGTDRARFRVTAHHNTLVVDECSQSEAAGPFSWVRLTHSNSERWVEGDSFDYFAGRHDGYTRLSTSVVHRRAVFALKSGMFLIRDLVLGRGSHQLRIGWNLHPELVAAEGNVFRFKDSSYGVAILPLQENQWKRSLSRIEYSPVYGSKRESGQLRFEAKTELPAEFATLLIAWSGTGEAGRGSFSRLPAKQAAPRGYRYKSGTAEYLFSFNDNGGAWECEGFSSDAEVVCSVRRSDPEEHILILCEGSYVRVHGGARLSCKSRVRRCELVMRCGVRVISCSEPNAIEREESVDNLAALIGQGSESAK